MNAARQVATTCSGLLLLGCVLVRAAGALAPASPPASAAHRFLIVLDTSRSMKARLPATLSMTEHLISSGLDGRLRQGDTIGLWTFSSELHAGAYPLQTWVPERRRQIALAMVSYLENIRFGGSTDLRKPLEAALELVKDSDSIAVLFITDGEEPFKGTGFDTEINAAIKRESRPLRGSGLPFAIFLTGKGGKLNAYAVNSAFKPLAYPEEEIAESKPSLVPTEPVNPEGTTPKQPLVEPPAIQPTAAAITNPPTESELKAAVSTQSETTNAAPVQPEFVVPVGRPQQTNAQGSTVLPQPVATIPAVTEPPPTSTEARTEPVQQQEPAIQNKPVEPVPPPETKTTVAATSERSLPTTNAATSTAESAKPVTETIVAPATNAAMAGTTTPGATTPVPDLAPVAGNEQKKVEPAETPAPPITATTAKIASETSTGLVVTANALAESGSRPIPSEVTIPAVATVVSSVPETQSVASGAASAPTALAPTVIPPSFPTQTMASPVIALTNAPGLEPVDNSSLGREPAPTNSPAPLLAAIPPEAGYSSRSLLIAAFTLLLVAAGLSLLLLRKRATAGASIITRSMDHDSHGG